MANEWHIFKGDREPHDWTLPEVPPWRRFRGKLDGKPAALEVEYGENDPEIVRGSLYQSDDKEIHLVNAALYLRRPLLITGGPGSGKSSLAYAVAYELKLGKVLSWPVTSRSTLAEALYRYDAIGRLQVANLREKGDPLPDIGEYIRLGPLGTALLPTDRPRVLLIDEIDKSNIDLPNDLLHVFETGEFEIPELARLPEEQSQVQVYTHLGKEKTTIERGEVVCNTFPFVVITSNGERELPPPFLRRCVRLDLDKQDVDKKLPRIVEAHMAKVQKSKEDQLPEGWRQKMIEDFLTRSNAGELATDQLLNAIFLTGQGVDLSAPLDSRDKLVDAILKYLSSPELS